MALSVEMSIIAARDAVARKQLQNLVTLVGSELRWIMEKAVFLSVSSQLQGGLQPNQLSPKYLLVLGAVAFLLIEPAPCTAQGDVSIGEAGIV
jgi:hypothetical protein